MKVTFLIFLFAVFATAGLAQRPVTIFLAGDSTMAPKQENRRPETGWGEMLEKHFKPGTVKVDNRALNGRSTTSFISEGRWQALIQVVQRGDYVFMQFGHNDQKKDKPGVYASPEDYKAHLTKWIAETRAKGATPILLTSVARRRFENGVLVKTHGEYPDLVKAVAKEQKVVLVDMEAKSSEVLTRYGEADSTKLFLQLKPGENANYPNGVIDNTHFSPLGAEEMALKAVEGIRELKISLGKLLVKK